MNKELIIDMIEVAASYLSGVGRSELYDQLDVVCKNDIPEMIYHIKNEELDVIDWNDVDDIKRVADILDNQVDGYDVFNHTTHQGHRTFGSIDADEQDIQNEMISYLNNEGYEVIDWDNADEVIRVAAILEKDIDGYYVFTHQEDAGHLDEMARMLRESAYMHTSPMYNRLQSAGIYHGHQQLHELLAHDGMMILPTVDRYLEDPTGSDMWESDFRDALDHFWSGRGSEDHAEKVKFVMQWLADQV